MRIVFLIPGTGRQFSGATGQSLALAGGLAVRGHDVTIAPLYTPLKSDGVPATDSAAASRKRPVPSPPAAAAADRDWENEDDRDKAAPVDAPVDYPDGLEVFRWRDIAAPPDDDEGGGVDGGESDPIDVACTAFRAGENAGPDPGAVIPYNAYAFRPPEPMAPSAGPSAAAATPAKRPTWWPLSFGGLNIRLQRKLPLADRWPAWLRRCLDFRALVDWAAGSPSATRPPAPGALLVDLLRGLDGPLRAETRRLVRRLAEMAPAPDAVVFGGVSCSGLAAALREGLPGVRLVCLAQGGDAFVEMLREPFRSRARRLVRQNARNFDRVLTTGMAGGSRAMGFMALSASRLRTLRPCVDGLRYGPLGQRTRRPFTIGYLSAIAPEKGLDRLAEAFHLLVLKKGREARLWIAGGVADAGYWRRVQRRLHRAGLAERVTVFGELDFAGKREFYRNLSVFCVPSRQPETRGTVFLEAMAAGVPVAAPGAGVLPELMRRTAGGVLLPPDAPLQYAEAFALMMDDPDTADNLGRWGRARVLRHYSVDVAAEELAMRLAELAGRG